MVSLSPEQVSLSACNFTYANFHLIWTIPQTLVLFVLARPFLTPLDNAKLILLPLIAFLWTTPWDSELIRSRAWAYPRDCVLFSVYRIPVEEYFFFIIQSIATTLITILTTRWFSPVNFVVTRSGIPSHLLWTGTSLSLALLGSYLTWSGGHNFYMGMVLWWSLIPIALLGWGSADFILQICKDSKSLLFLSPLVITSTYLCFGDLFALKRGTWVISAHTSLGIDVVPQLPIEEFTFFWVTNLIIITACFAFDRCAAVSRIIRPDKASSKAPLSPINFPLSLSSIRCMWTAFLWSPSDREGGIKDELFQDPLFSEQILKAASKSFWTASLLLPWDLRSDLGSAYAFARVTDDLIDLPSGEDSKEQSKGKKIKLLNLLEELIDSAYQSSDLKSRQQSVEDCIKKNELEWLNDGETVKKLRGAMRALLELCDLVPKELFMELLEGYETDLDLEEAGVEGKLGFKSMEDLINYSERVAGSVGELCVRIVLTRLGLQTPPYQRPQVNSPSDQKKPGSKNKQSVSKYEELIRQARRMGVALQLINISRDTSSDALRLKRCYLPASMFSMEEALFIKSSLIGSQSVEKEESREGLKLLRKKALGLLSLADSEYEASYPALQRLPSSPARTGLRVACSAYADIGRAVKLQGDEEALLGIKARPTNLRRLWVVLKALYWK